MSEDEERGNDSDDDHRAGHRQQNDPHHRTRRLDHAGRHAGLAELPSLQARWYSLAGAASAGLSRISRITYVGLFCDSW